jgi:hypothetical protein
MVVGAAWVVLQKMERTLERRPRELDCRRDDVADEVAMEMVAPFRELREVKYQIDDSREVAVTEEVPFVAMDSLEMEEKADAGVVAVAAKMVSSLPLWLAVEYHADGRQNPWLATPLGPRPRLLLRPH